MSKIVVKSLWIGPKLSDLEILSIKSFLKCGHRMHLYTYHPIENIPKHKDLLIKDGNKIIKYEELINLKSLQLPFSDIFRYKMLYEKGGYWVDLDMICLKKLNFSDKFIFSSENTIQKGQFRNRKGTFQPNIGILKAPRKSQFYKDVFVACVKEVNKKIKNNIQFMVILKKFITKYGYEKYVKPPNHFCPLNWWHTKEAFYPPCCKEKYGTSSYEIKDILDNSYTIHMWRSIMKKRHKINPNDKYNNKSLYEILKKKYL